MRQEAYRDLLILHIDPEDSLSAILQQTQGTSATLLLVLPAIATTGRKAFTQLKDFHALRARGNAQKFSFVIPEKQARQWARESGFSLQFSSLEEARAKIRPFQAKIAGNGQGIHTQQTAPISLLESSTAPLTSSTSLPLPPLESSYTAPLSSARQNPRKRILLLLPALCLITILAGSFFFFVQHVPFPASQPTRVSSDVVGTVSFQSSRAYNQSGTSGINDHIAVSLQHLAAPALGMAYYAWLLNDTATSDEKPLLLGTLTLHNGGTTLEYSDPHQGNLLFTFSKFLITEEPASTLPLVPSTEQKTWKYGGMIVQTPNLSDVRHFSLLDHLRHLLAKDPTLEALGLHGGLDFWQYKNSGKLIEWAQSARDYWGQSDTSFLRRQLIRTLDYLDGSAFVSQDVAPGTPLLVDPLKQRAGLIDVTPNQTPEGYFPHIDYHLTSLITAPGATWSQKARVTTIVQAINGVTALLQHARQDAKQLLALSDKQLRQPEMQLKLDELANLTNDAYTGNQEQQGSLWIHQQLAQLAVIDVRPYAE